MIRIRLLVLLLPAALAACSKDTVEPPAGGDPPSCSVAPASLPFGAVAVGESRDLTFTITNAGSDTLAGEVGPGTAPFEVVSGTGAYTLGRGDSLVATVRYTPPAAGSHAASIETGAPACGEVACAGTGTSAPSAGFYVLFGVNNGRQTWLIDQDKNFVHTWSHTRSGGYSAYLLEDGSLLRTAVGGSGLNGGGAQGVVQKIGPDGTTLWEYTYSDGTRRSHHDIEPMPNGNVLLIAWEKKTAAEATAAGRVQAGEIWPDHIVEVQPSGSSGGTIVWEWHGWDHLVQDRDPGRSNYGQVAEHPELLDVNLSTEGGGIGGGDWMHLNGISYDPERDQIVVSSHALDEIYVIDHGTTTAEAAAHTGGRRGHGGDFLYRWGRPANYGRSEAAAFNVVHCSVWIPAGLPGAGHILAFSNREGQWSSLVVELALPEDGSGNYVREAGAAWGPSGPAWSYTSGDFYSNHLGACQRLPSGNTLIVESTKGHIFEVNPAGEVTWSYPRGAEIARALRYEAGYSGLAGLGITARQ